MSNVASILPRGAGSNRRRFDQMIKDISAYYPLAYEKAYTAEIRYLIKEIIDFTPIDTGAAAGVTSNQVGTQKRELYKGHKAFGGAISNDPGGTGWQLVRLDTKAFNVSIINPQWSSYLKFLEYGIVNPLPPANSHFVYRAWQSHLKRREMIREIIKRGRA